MSLKGTRTRRRVNELLQALQRPLPGYLRRVIVSALEAVAASFGAYVPWSSVLERFLRVEPRLAQRLFTRTLTETGESLTMSLREFPMTGGGITSVSSYTDKLHSNAPQLAKLSMDTGRFFNMDNGDRVLDAQYGLQEFGTVCRALFRTEILQMFQQVADASGLDTTGGGFSPETMSIYIKDLWMHVDMVNSSNVPMYLEIYDIRPRKDIAANTADYPAAIITPDPFYYRGIDDLYGNTTMRNYMMTDPFMARPFVEYFNVYKTTRIMLQPGEYHTHRVHFAPNRLIQYREVGTVDPQIQQPAEVFERLTYFTFVRFHGAPIVASPVSGPDFATYSKCRLGICWWSKVQFTFGMPVADDMHATDNLMTPAVNVAKTVLPTGTVANVEIADP